MYSKKINNSNFLVTLFLISLLSEGVFIDISFALKLYMILTPLVLLYVLKFGISRFYNFEKLYLVFSIYYMVGSFFTSNPIHSLKYSIVILFALVCTILFKNYLIVKSKVLSINDILVKALGFFSLVSLIMYIIGIYKLGFNFYSAGGENVRVFGVMLDRSTPRLIGLGNDPNNFVFAVTLPWYYLAFKKHKSRMEFIVFLLLTLCIILTFSRGGWLGLFLPFFVYYLVNFKKINFKYLLLFSTIMMYLIYSNYSTLYRLLDEGIENRLTIGTGSGRFDIWEKAIIVFNENIFFGLGADMYHALYEKYVHNLFLQIMVDGGIFGLVLFIMFLVALYHQIKSIYKVDKNYVFLILCFLSLIIQMMGLSILYNECWILILGYVGYLSYANEVRSIKK